MGTEFLHAAYEGDVAGVQRLVAAALTQRQRRNLLRERSSNNYDMTALHFAAMRGHEQCLRALLTANAESGAAAAGDDGGDREPLLLKTDWYGNTVLHYAANQGHEECVLVLLATAAATSEGLRRTLLLQKNNCGWSALHSAASKKRHDQCAAALLADGAGSKEERLELLRAKGSNGCTASMCAEHHGSTNLAALLRKAEEELEQELRRANAEAALEAAMTGVDGVVDAGALEAAIAEAGAAEVGKEKLQVARRLLREAKEKSAAAKAVQVAVKGGSVALLHVAMAQFEAMSTSSSPDAVQNLSAVLQRMAEGALGASVTDGSLALLRSAIEEAETAGVERSSDLDDARKLLGLFREAAKSALATAMTGEGECLPTLHTAMAQAAAAGVSTTELQA